MRNLNDTTYWKQAMRTGLIGTLRPEILVSAIRDRTGEVDEDVWLAVHGQVARDAMAEMRKHRHLQRGGAAARRVERNLSKDDKSPRPDIKRIEVDDILDEALRILLEALEHPRDALHARLADALADAFPAAIRSIVGRAYYHLETKLNDSRKVPAEPEVGKDPNRRVMRAMSSLDHEAVVEAAAREDEGFTEVDYMRLLAMMRRLATARGVLPELDMRLRGDTFEEIGKALGVSGQAVRNRLAALFDELEMDPDYVNRKRAAARKSARLAAAAPPSSDIPVAPRPDVAAPTAGPAATRPGDGGTTSPVPGVPDPGSPDAPATRSRSGGGGNDPGPGTPMAAAP